ncbi:hypothetical protein NC653_030228 [Populus alba x Populus x berolinensis]|uniref:Uncharacterized protein n=1 Tax=Populus alba x Populus x berolinensis TaxID=444605 RepID=A0AAD6Q015_9ROSI|nr:hypothetical protein NC653_030228 [Populus alba x Populus x berolinensis]
MSMELTVHRLPIAQQMDPHVEAKDSFLTAPSMSSQPSSHTKIELLFCVGEFLLSTSLLGKYDLILLWTECGFELVFKTDIEAEDSFLAAPSISSQPSSSEFLSSTSLPGKYDLILLWTECGFELVFKTGFSGVIKSTMFKSSPFIGSKGGMSFSETGSLPAPQKHQPLQSIAFLSKNRDVVLLFPSNTRNQSTNFTRNQNRKKEKLVLET